MNAYDPFTGTRLRLRAWEPDDVSALHEYITHPALIGRRRLPWGFPPEAPLTRAQAAAAIEKWSQTENGLALAICRLEDGALIGHARCDWNWEPLAPYADLAIAPAQWRQGFGAEAAGVLMRYLFTRTPAHAIVCDAAGWDAPARAFAASLGFTETGGMRRIGLKDGRPYDLVFCNILRDEWLARAGKEVSHAAGG
jgi:RimJ/RimL family protein N-acetyltransferase